MNLHAFAGDQDLHIDKTEQGWEWAVFHRRRDRSIKTGVAKSLELAKTAAAQAAEVEPETLSWKLVGADS
jgi:hypothetical protein